MDIKLSTMMKGGEVFTKNYDKISKESMQFFHQHKE